MIVAKRRDRHLATNPLLCWTTPESVPTRGEVDLCTQGAPG